MKRFFVTVALLFTLSVLYAQHRDRHIVVISLDAFRWDLFEKAHTPTLDSLKRAGAFSNIYPVFPSNTFPSHYAMATGLHPNNNGMVNNNYYDYSLGRGFAMSDRTTAFEPQWWGGEPIWKTVEDQGLKSAVFMWVGSEVDRGESNPSRVVGYDSAIPFEQRMGWVVEEMNRPAEEVPNLIMCYSEEPDAVGHAFGIDSPQAVAKAGQLDSLLAVFFASVRSSPVFDKTDFIVLSDHGMSSPERIINLYGVLDPGRIRRYVPGLPLSLEPDEDYRREAHDIIAGIDGLTPYFREETPDRWHYGSNRERIMPLIVMPDPGIQLEYTSDDPTMSAGIHGYDPLSSDMSMIFFAGGPHFKKSHIQKPFQNQNLYLIIATILGLDPAPNDGVWEDIKDIFVE